MLTFSTAVELAQSMELVEQQARLMNDRQEVEIDKIRVEKTSGSGKCHRCGRGGHYAKNCRFKNAVCHLCKKRGHIQAACYTRSVVKKNGSGRGSANAKETRWIELKEVNEERLRVYQLENQASSAY
jgi:CxxC motif-containing protein